MQFVRFLPLCVVSAWLSISLFIRYEYIVRSYIYECKYVYVYGFVRALAYMCLLLILCLWHIKLITCVIIWVEIKYATIYNFQTWLEPYMHACIQTIHIYIHAYTYRNVFTSITHIDIHGYLKRIHYYWVTNVTKLYSAHKRISIYLWKCVCVYCSIVYLFEHMMP